MRDNGGSHYTTEMFLKAEKEIEEKKEQLLKESEAQRNKELEELKARYDGELLELKKEMMERIHEAETRAQAEIQNAIHPVRFPPRVVL